MIISASRRTDIPAFYADLFMDNVRAGYCVVTNPFNPKQVSRISLAADDVDVIVFWTKNPQPMLQHLKELESRSYKFYFLYTLNDYPPILEPGLEPLEKRLDLLKELAAHIGREKVIWRYDPIIVSDITPPSRHLDSFSAIARELSGYTERVIVSLVDDYKRAAQRLTNAGIGYRTISPDSDEIKELMSSLSTVASNTGLEIFSCAEPLDLSDYGIKPGKCIDDEYIDRVFGITVSSAKDTSQRKACGCVKSRDIGTYNTCQYQCRYCYATHQKTC